MLGAMDFTRLRTRLLEDDSSFYLGTIEAGDELEWYPTVMGKRGHMVVNKAAVTAYNESWEALSREATTGQDVKDLKQVEAATLTFVAAVSDRNCFLTPCGNWKGPTNLLPSLADVKLGCELVAPHNTAFAGDFPRVIRNLESLARLVTNKKHDSKGILDWRSKPRECIQVRHCVFQTKDEDAYEDSDLKKWPVKNHEAGIALQSMRNTHVVNELPAYDIHRHLIPPSEHMKALGGAIVRVAISLRHWSIDKQAKDVYTADIVSLSVIGSASGPKKRRAPAFDPWLDQVIRKKVRLVDGAAGRFI
ncbi:hypothetical protein R3P38DRAFT_3221693 [Favolaschia claudopus]|uniref:Uncharacterized protein n=1 Tax=Favolaschia claudopus TaxID=2862362 RepID=A0AAV9ZZZ2_9AGAR